MFNIVSDKKIKKNFNRIFAKKYDMLFQMLKTKVKNF